MDPRPTWLVSRIFRLRPRCRIFSTATVPVHNASLVYNPYYVEHDWKDPQQLANYLYSRIVTISQHFVVLDKPPGLSVWGHSVTNREIMKLLSGSFAPGLGDLCLKDALPHLAKLIQQYEREQMSASSINRHVTAEVLPKLDIVEPIPALYSGLVLLGRTSDFVSMARKFYLSAMTGKPPWQMYQQFFAVCIHKPFSEQADDVRFPIGSHSLNEYVRIGYRPPPGVLSGKHRKDGTVLQKCVSHRSLVPTCTDFSLIDLRVNSTFRGLPEVYLLHEGCAIIGEPLQSSRLVDTGLTPIVLPPNQVKLNQGVPLWLRRRLGNPNLSNLPAHIHRVTIFLPTPVPAKRKKGTFQFLATVNAPLEIPTVPNPLLQELPTVSWTRLDALGSTTPRFVLTCRSPNLPNYFLHSMQRLNLDFDYSSWLLTESGHELSYQSD